MTPPPDLPDLPNADGLEERLRHSEEISLQVSRLAQIGAWELQVSNRRLRWEPELYRICEVELGYEPTLGENDRLFRQRIPRIVHPGGRPGDP